MSLTFWQMALLLYAIANTLVLAAFALSVWRASRRAKKLMLTGEQNADT